MSATRYFAILFLFLVSCITPEPAKTCIETRAAFDIGSGGTRMKVAKVDLCNLKLLELYAEEETKVSYKDDLESRQSKEFSNKIKAEGLKALRLLKTNAEKYNPDTYIGGATSAFREALNGAAFAKHLSKSTGIQIRVLSAEDEGVLGFLGAVAHANSRPQNTVMWDIGGGSKQFAAMDFSGSGYDVYSDTFASIKFKNTVIETILKRDPTRSHSPNPIGKINWQPAAAIVEKNAARIPAQFVDLLNRSNTTVIGIGGVHYYSVRGQVGSEKDYFTIADVERAISERIDWTDKQIGGDYASTDVTNLILVHTYMKVLGIEKVYPVKVNMADGLLLDNRSQ